MSAEERLEALEQVVAALQGEVLNTRAVALQAEQRATEAETRLQAVRGEGVVDTRLLGKPKSFDGTAGNWRQFKFTFLGYAGAVDARLKQAMIESEVLEDAAIMNAALPARDQQVSTQLYYMLVLLLEGSAQRLLEHAGDGEGLLSWRRLVAEYEPATAGRETSLLLEVLGQTFKGDVRGALDDFEVKVRRYERTCGDALSDRVKIAVVQKGLEDEDLRRHLLMHAARLTTYPLVREEIRDIIMARDTLSGPTPMDVGAVYKGKGKGKSKGKKGKGKGKVKDKDTEKDPVANPDAGVICYHCHRKGHRKRDCRVLASEKQKKHVNSVEEQAQSEGSTRISMVELDDWILMINVDEREEQVGSIERVMVDSGAAVSVCPLGYAPEIPIAHSTRNALLRTASGAHIEHAGQKSIQYEHDGGGSVNVNFEVADVTRPLVAVGELQRRGMTVVMGPHGSFVTRGRVTKPSGDSLNLEHSNGAYWMRMSRGENGTQVLAPIELENPVPTTSTMTELPSVEDTIDVAHDHPEAQIPTAVPSPKEPNAF